MDSLNLFKKTLTMLLFAPLWVGAAELQVELDAATLDLGSMSTSSSIGFSVQCISNGQPKRIQSVCGNYLLSLSSLNDYELIHDSYPGYSINHNSTIVTPGTLSSNGKTYTSQILIVPAFFPVSQHAGTYTDSLTLTVSDNN